MSESLEEKQNKVKAAVEIYNNLLSNQRGPFDKSEKAFNLKEAVKFFGKPYFDKIVAQHNSFSEKEFTGDYLLYLIVVYIAKELKEPISIYLGSKKNVLHLEGAYLSGEHDAKFDFSNCNIEESHFENALLTHVVFYKTMLSFVTFQGATLRGVTFAELDSEQVSFLHTEITDFLRTDKSFLKNVTFKMSDFSFSKIECLEISHVDLNSSNMRNAVFELCEFSDVDCCWVKINNETFFIECGFDSLVNFNNTSLALIRDESVRSKLIYSSRRIKWSNYCSGLNELPCTNLSYIKRGNNNSSNYDKHIYIFDLFWFFSDYGYSTKRILKSFLVASLFFAVIYWTMGAIDFLLLGNQDRCWGCVANLFQSHEYVFVFSPFSLHGILRTLYFSIVTMTTLGFGDIYADPNSLLGYALLSGQVIMGYVLLGVLITRVSVLFTGNELFFLPRLAERHKEKDKKIKMFLWFFSGSFFAILVVYELFMLL
jgi:uncharacterized protein YjbI with pentapeptide repeats